MEHLEGESLATRIEREGALRIASATDIARQMASGLHAAHAAGIVHRDVKPENVILTTRAGRLDHVKLLDFGIAKLESSRRDTGRSLVLGTPAYMSPEQARGQSLDARADVYSLGVVLFELLTGQLPFDDAHPLLVVRRHATEPVPPIRQLREDIPIPLAELVTEMLAKRPEERPSSMGEVSERLAPWASTSHVVVTRPSPMPLVIPAAPSAPTARGPDFSRPTPARADTPTKAAPPARRLRGEWIGALGLVLVGTIVGAIVAGFLARRSEGPRIAPAAESPPIAAPSVPAERVAPPQTSPPATLVSAPPSSPSVPPIPLRHVGSAHVAAPPSEAPAAPTEPAVDPPRPPTFGEQNLLDPWE
jgi:serine/threonine-protein kinase